MNQYLPSLAWLEEQFPEMIGTLRTWADTNTGSRNISGLERFLSMLEEAFQPLNGETEAISLPPQTILSPSGLVSFPLGRALRVVKRPEARIRVLLTIHYDTVYGPDHPSQTCAPAEGDLMRGPGTADAKGGLLILLKALQAFERSPWADRLGWEVLIVPDEEIGSPGSNPIMSQAAGRNHVAFVFEPGFDDGSLINERKGSAVYSLMVKGRAAHPGREPEKGRNAIHALADFIVETRNTFLKYKGVILNVAEVTGGGPANVVPDLAYCRFNVRADNPETQKIAHAAIRDIEDRISQLDGFSLEAHVDSFRPPMVRDAKTTELLGRVAECGEEIGVKVSWRSSGGASDGNILVSAGLPALDGFGALGGNLHSKDEYVRLNSLLERSKLAALVMMKLANGDIRPPG